MKKSTRNPQSRSHDRRKFLTRTGVLIGALSAAGYLRGHLAEAQGFSEQQAKSLNAVMDEAMRTKKIGDAIEKQGKDLPDDIKNELRKLTPEDLRAAAQVDKKLAGLKGKVPAANIGILGM